MFTIAVLAIGFLVGGWGGMIAAFLLWSWLAQVVYDRQMAKKWADPNRERTPQELYEAKQLAEMKKEEAEFEARREKILRELEQSRVSFNSETFEQMLARAEKEQAELLKKRVG
jgi:hypothetical protein